MLERLLSEMEAPEEKRLKRPRRLVACVHNAQRLPAVRELQRREQQGELDVIVFIPFGEKYEDFGKILEGMRMTWRRAKKRDYERMIVEVGPDIVLTLGWPFILTEASLAHKPRILFLNSHPSLLPRHRGFSPFWGAIRDGDAEAGATVHEIAPGIDDGPILLQTAFPLDRFDTYLSVKRRTFACEADGVRRALDLVVPLLDDAARLLTLFAPQDEKRASWTAKRGSADSEVDPTRPLVDLYDAIRYCDPDAFPAYFFVEGQKVEVVLRRAVKPAGAREDTL